jgi:2-haloacid dehalogenase
VFGTCVDWRTSVARQARELGDRLGVGPVDWPAFADAWRARYDPQMENVRSGARPWATVDVLHREALDDVLAEFGLDEVSDHHRDELTLAWHRLDTWPDVVEGLTALRRHYVIAPNSNGHIALQVALARYAGLPWDAILGAELARTYKPEPEVYLRSVEALGLRPPDVLMVAAHGSDLDAAAACGLHTAFVPRPHEHGRPPTGKERPRGPVDVEASDFVELSEALRDLSRGEAARG